MCGLIGYIGAQPPDLLKIKLLFAINQERGTDSCGVFVEGQGIVKVEGKAIFNLLPHINIPDGRILLGHVRQGTHGSKTKENSHPFSAGTLVQTHNGTLTNWASWARENGFYTTTNVDSHAMVKLFNKLKTEDGVDNYIGEGLQEIEGAIALMLHDRSVPNVIKFYRNKERPLFFGGLNDSELYFSSLEEGLLSIGIPQNRIMDAKTDTIYTAEITNDNLINVSSIEFVKVKKQLTSPNFQNAPQKSQNQNVTLWSNQSSKTTLEKSILESLTTVYQDCLNQKPKNFSKNTNVTLQNTSDIIAIGKTVEFMNERGEIKEGKIVSHVLPYQNVYIIQESNILENNISQRLNFCHKEYIIEIEEPGAKIIKMNPKISMDSISINSKIDYVTNDGKTHCYGGKVTMINDATKEVRVETRTGSGSLSVILVPLIDITKVYENSELATFTPKVKYECNECCDTGIAGDEKKYFACSCSIGQTVEVTNEDLNNNGVENYDDYEDAASLYADLVNTPGFNDAEGTFEQLNSYDVTLKSMVNCLNQGLVSDDDVRRFKENLMDIRCNILLDMIEKAKEIENTVV